jgi:hypothetical protein
MTAAPFDNAWKWAKAAVTISAKGKGVTIAIEDDAPSPPQVFGSGLGLAVDHEAYGCSLTFGNITPRGFRAAVFFPSQSNGLTLTQCSPGVGFGS